jgi:serine/threonine protein kinase
MNSYELDASIGNGPGSAVWRANSTSGGSYGQQVILTIVPAVTFKGAPIPLDNLLGIADLWHPNLAKIFNVGGSRGQVCLAEERIQGLSLHTLARPVLERGGSASRRRILRALGIACKALAYLHEHGLYHGGLNSKRVMLTESGWVKLRGAGLIKVGTAHRIAHVESAGGARQIEHGQARDRWAVVKMIEELALDEDPRAARALRDLRRETRPTLNEVSEAFLSTEVGTPATWWWQAPSDTP